MTAKSIALAATLLATLATASARPQPAPECDHKDCGIVLYIPRYGRAYPVQYEYLDRLPCLNLNPDAILFEDGAIYCPEWGN